MFSKFYKVLLRIAIALEKLADIEPKPKNASNAVEMLEKTDEEELEEIEEEEKDLSRKSIDEILASNELKSPYPEDNLTEEQLEAFQSRM